MNSNKLSTEAETPALNKGDVMGCLPFPVIFEFCLTCDKVTPFVKTLKCLYCDCDSPFGDFHDKSINDDDLTAYINQNTISIGLMSQIPINVVGFLNSP